MMLRINSFTRGHSAMRIALLTVAALGLMGTSASSGEPDDSIQNLASRSYAEREAAKRMIDDARQATENSTAIISIGADKGYDAQEFTAACLAMNVVPHIAQNTSGRRSSVPEAIAATVGYAVSQQKMQTHRAGLRLGQDNRADAPGHGARYQASRSDVRADDAGLQLDAHVLVGTDPSALSVKGETVLNRT